MEEDRDILERAAEILKNETIPPGPSPELIEATMSRLAETARQEDTIPLEGRIRLRDRLKTLKNLNKVAAAAVLLIVSGYAVGRLTAPRPPDMEQIQAALEPTIRRNLVNEVSQHLQSGYVGLINELDRQYREELNRVAMQILTASNVATNKRLSELIDSINDAQTHQRQWLTAALEQMESNRIKDTTQLSDALTTVALQTGEELERTKQDMVQLLSYTQPSPD
ncbi:MAG: hypothetical protein A2Z25_15530 [Planctomycetes bacterium RBG_16_55_9]|nr:MAG: hypothetical protein A2Z25_15530 [Planctomycetes bacterium RBG_16_55_9]